MRDLEIAFYPNTYYSEQGSDKIFLIEKITKRQFELPSSLSILFLGKKQQKFYTANAFGQIVVDRKPLQNIFTAGDCSYYQSPGSNTLTAQSAVRKGKLVARNILRHSGFPGLLEPYMHHELGYVVSIGAADAVGWLVSERNVITGIPALTIKELVEAQYDLLLAGIDTYLV
jgi:NADH dehydrogenase